MKSQPATVRFSLYPKLRDSVHHLATQKGSLGERLKRIYESHLISIEPSHYPKEIEKSLIAIFSKYTEKDETFDGQGRVNATLETTNVVTHSKIADLIFNLYEEIK